MANNRIDKPVVPPASVDVNKTRGDNAFGGGRGNAQAPFTEMGPVWPQRHGSVKDQDISKRINPTTKK